MIEYVVLKQKRKTASIAVDKDLKVVVKVPRYMSQKEIAKLVSRHEAWIQKTLDRKTLLNETQDFIKTNKLLYLGTYWPIRLEKGDFEKGKISFEESSGFHIQTSGDEVQIRELVEQFYREKAKVYLTQITQQYAAHLELVYHKITIRKQNTRWGSCSKQGNLSYNLRILCAPMEMIEYIVLHEVMHLRHFDHSKSFWKAIEAEMPDYRRRMNYFKEF